MRSTTHAIKNQESHVILKQFLSNEFNIEFILYVQNFYKLFTASTWMHRLEMCIDIQMIDESIFNFFVNNHKIMLSSTYYLQIGK